MLKIRKLINKNGIWYSIREYTQVDNNPTAIAAILIMLDDTKEGEMLEITRIQNDTKRTN